MSEIKRYAVKVDFYVYAETDKEVIEKAAKFSAELNKKFDNQTQVLQIDETPFGATTSRSVFKL